MDQNRRQFSRVPFHCTASLFLPSGEHPVEVLDLSLKGALIHPPATLYVGMGTHCTLKIRLDAMGSTIRMEGTIVHHLTNYYGLVCTEIDLDSVTHLRRLVELNLGDGALADREFAHLSHK